MQAQAMIQKELLELQAYVNRKIHSISLMVGTEVKVEETSGEVPNVRLKVAEKGTPTPTG